MPPSFTFCFSKIYVFFIIITKLILSVLRYIYVRTFRDSGAGNGQSSSLIVGLGEYAGGELAVEGVVS